MTTREAIGELVEAAFVQFGGKGDARPVVIRRGMRGKTALQRIPERRMRQFAAAKIDPEPIRLTLDMPPSANRYWRSNPRGGVYVSEEARTYKADVAVMAHAQGLRDALAGDVAVTVRVFRAQRSGDLDNRLKVLLDALRGVAYGDDKQVIEIHAFRFEDKANPRVEVEISER